MTQACSSAASVSPVHHSANCAAGTLPDPASAAAMAQPPPSAHTMAMRLPSPSASHAACSAEVGSRQ